MSSDIRKTGLFLVGARGAIATTVLHGLEGLRSGMAPVGLLTERPEFREVPFEPVGAMRACGWDIAGDCHRAADELARIGVLPHDLVDLCGEMRDRYEYRIAPGVADPRDADLVDAASRERLDLPLPEAVAALRADMRSWIENERLHRAVVVYLATAERSSRLPGGWEDPEADPLELLAAAPADLSRSLLYAVAAVAEGLPFVNFTPAVGGACPALAGWARRQGVPVLGNDGKTGETLLKTVLAPMFRDRALNVMSWEGYNMLGNRDGAALSDPDRKAGKLVNKDAVLQGILRQPTLHSGVSIDFVPSLHDWKTAWDFIHFEGFLGARMSLQFTWQGSDSALAAPLVIDLARLALLAQDRGEGGPLLPAAPFFKAPLGLDEHDFHRQMEILRGWLLDGER